MSRRCYYHLLMPSRGLGLFNEKLVPAESWGLLSDHEYHQKDNHHFSPRFKHTVIIYTYIYVKYMKSSKMNVIGDSVPSTERSRQQGSRRGHAADASDLDKANKNKCLPDGKKLRRCHVADASRSYWRDTITRLPGSKRCHNADRLCYLAG